MGREMRRRKFLDFISWHIFFPSPLLFLSSSTGGADADADADADASAGAAAIGGP